MAVESAGEMTETSKKISGLALANIVSHMEDVRENSGDNFAVFKLSEVQRMYVEEMAELGYEGDSHKTRLKERLLMICPDLEASDVM